MTLNQATQDSIRFTIANFENYCMETYGKSNIISDMKKSNDEEVFEVIQNWINFNNDKAPSSVRTYFSHLRKYLYYMGIKLDEQDIRAELTFKHKVSEELHGMTLIEAQKILNQMRFKHRVQYMCQLSSLMRIGEIIQLRKKHLRLGDQNIIVKIPSSIAKFKKARTTFFSKEASKLLYPIVNKMKDNDLVFGTSDNPDHSDYTNKLNSLSATKLVLRASAKRAGLTEKYESTGRYTINTHSFRAYGITKLSRLDPNFAKKLAGQKGYLLQYDRMDDDEKLELYEKFEYELTVDDSEAKKEEIKQLKEEKKSYEKREKERVLELKELIRKEILEDLMKERPFISIQEELEQSRKAVRRAKKKQEEFFENYLKE